MSEDSISNEMNKDGVSRRDFMKLCGLMAGMMGLEYLPPSAKNVVGGNLRSAYAPARLVAKALSEKPRLPVIWLELQDCAGCSEALSRSESRTLGDLVLNKIKV